MRNFLTWILSKNCECYVLFGSSLFAIKELQQMWNKNHGTGINNQKQPWKGVLNIEWKKLLDILSKKVNSRYRSETLLKQISLQVPLNYCINILVVGFVYFLNDFSRRRSSDLKAFCKKRFVFKKIQNSKENTCAKVSF